MPRKSIKEIAALAGVSIGTVDRVLHNRGRVAPETEATIRRIILELDYKPNVFASALKTGKMFRFGVLMPRPGPFCEYWELPLNGILRAARELAHLNVRVETFFFDLAGAAPRFTEAADGLVAAELDACILAPVLTEDFRSLLDRLPPSMPYLFMDSFLPGTRPLTVIAQDSHQAGRTAGRLMELLLPGGGEVVILRNLPSDFHLQEREKGFCDHLAGQDRIGLSVEAVDLAAQGDLLEGHLEEIGLRHPAMRGIFVTNANIAPYLRLNQLRPQGERLVCVGFDLIAANRVALRSGVIDFLISQQPEEYGYLGVKTLYRHLVLKEPVPARIQTPVEIVMKENMAD